MGDAYLQIRDARGARREPLRPGRTRLGGPGSDVVVGGVADADELHVWDDPPRAVFVGSGARPTRAGRAFEEAGLAPGDRLEWRGVTIEYVAPEPLAALEELPPSAAPAPATPAAPAGVPTAGPSPAELRVLRRLQAGMAVELGLADRARARAWQEAVVRGEFDPDRCAEEIVLASGLAADDPRLLERSARLLRDLLMAPLQRGARGAARRTRRAVRSGVALVVSQGLALLVYTAIVAAVLLVLRLKGVEIDAWLDRALLRSPR